MKTGGLIKTSPFRVPIRQHRLVQTGAGRSAFDQFLRDSRIISSVGGALGGIAGGLVGGPVGAAAGGALTGYAISQTGYGRKKRKGKKPGPKPKKRKTKRK
jgi:hypothetical protein